MRWWLIPALLVAACASPNPALYTLAVMPGPTLGAAPHSIAVRRIGLAGYLDRPGIVRSSENYKLQIASDDRWGEPLGGLLLRVLAEDLSQRLPNSAVYADSGAISADPDAVIEIDLRRLDADSTGTVVLAAEVSVRASDSHAHSTTRSVRLTITPASTSTGDYVAALSALVGQFADVIAKMLSQQ